MLGIVVSSCSSDNGGSSIIYPKEPPRDRLYDSSIINDEAKWGMMNVHDPSIFKDGEWYYIFSTDVKVGGMPRAGIQVRKSKDLIHWQWVGYALDGVPEEAEKWTGATNLWAPDVTKIGDTYYLYYVASTFGKNQSFIGVATSKSIEGPWEDKGAVLKSRQGDEWNALDPNIVYDADGNIWMDFGSFFGGIYIIQLDPKTGKPLEGARPKLIARRGGQDAIEGPYIIYNKQQKKYYLFTSFDSLMYDYNVRVARSDRIDGPYADYNGNLMTDTSLNAGTKILNSYQFEGSNGWVATGHNSVLQDGNDYYIIHHARGDQDTNWPYLHVRKILWSDDGWPMVSPERYAGEFEQQLNREDVIGDWQIIELDKDDNSQLTSTTITLLKNGKIDKGNGKDYWEFSGKNNVKLYFYDPDHALKGAYRIETAKVIPAWDWENWRPTLVFTGFDQNGTAVWGKRIKP
uniref:arabinan endo-1,5-alpha-L-arabinosidase n=1 Tax=Caldanaerobius polysaccharolyticus TaxID=44256 RepID=UPI003899051B